MSVGFSCKIADFGLSRTQSGVIQLLSSQHGAALFAAPELLSSGCVGFESDAYAFGIVAWHLMSMDNSEADLEDYQVRYQVCERGWRPSIFSNAPVPIKELVSRCWSQDRTNRPSFAEIRKLLSKLLVTAQEGQD